MPFNIGDARELTNYKSACMIMNDTVAKYGKVDYMSYRDVLRSNSDKIINDSREEANQRLQTFIQASIGK